MNLDNNVYSYAAKLVDYNEETGKLTWLTRVGNRPQDKIFNSQFAGKECGYLCSQGYIKISIWMKSRRFVIASHRLAWLLFHNRLPCGEIDHINGVRNDNRLLNLRDVSASINHRNSKMRKDNTSGVTGVSWYKPSQKWVSHASSNGKQKTIGYFDTLEEASEAVRLFRRQNSYTERHGLPITADGSQPESHKADGRH